MKKNLSLRVSARALCFILIIFLFSGIGFASGKEGLKFRLIPLSTASDYWIAMRQGAEDAAQKYSNKYGEIKIQFIGTRENGDVAGQIDILNNAVTARVDGILLAATNPAALLFPVQQAIESGVPVVTADSGVEPNIANSFLATDNYNGCKKLAEYMAELVGYEGKYAIIGDSLEFTSGRERPVGFDDGMQQFEDMKGVGMLLAYSDILKASEIALSFIESQPDLDIIFAQNDRASIGAINAFRQKGIKGEIKLCCVDVGLETLKAMREGIVQAAILQKPYDMGYKGVETLLDIIDGKEVEKFVDTGVFLLTPDNMDSDEAISAIRQYIPDYKPE